MNDEAVLKILIEAYVSLNKLHAEPGPKCHMLAQSIHVIERLIKEVIKKQAKS